MTTSQSKGQNHGNTGKAGHNRTGKHNRPRYVITPKQLRERLIRAGDTGVKEGWAEVTDAHCIAFYEQWERTLHPVSPVLRDS